MSSRNLALSRLRTLAKNKGEGSRGGKIVGHTRAGHPIYEHDGRLTFSAKHAQWHAEHSIPHTEPVPGHRFSGTAERPTGDHVHPATRAVVPLVDDYTAQHHIREIEDTEHGPVAFGDWTVHGPDGTATHHQLDDSFLDEAQGVAEGHKEHITEARIPHPHEVGYHGQPSPQKYADDMIDAGRGHLINSGERSSATPR